MGPSTLLPVRDEDLARLVEASDAAEGSRLVVIDARVGDDSAPLLSALAERLRVSPRWGGAEQHRLVALSWQSQDEWALLAPLGLEAPLPGASPWQMARQWLADRGADRGLVMLVEAAQHADLSSLRLLTSAVHQQTSSPVLVVLELVRDDTLGPREDPQRRLQQDEMARAAHVVLRPGALTEHDVAVLARQRGVELAPGTSQRLLDHCEGRAHEIVETLEVLRHSPGAVASGPLPVAESVRARVRASLKQLSAASLALVQAIAALEVAMPQQPVLVCEAAALVEDAGPRALDELLSSALVERVDPASRIVRMASAAVRRCVLDEAGQARRAELHVLAARATEDPEVRLRHEWLADPTPTAQRAEAFDTLAVQHARRGDWMEAGRLWELASQAASDQVSSSQYSVKAADAVVAAGDLTLLAGGLAQLEASRETPMREACLGYVGCLSGRPTTAGKRLGRSWELTNPQRDPAVARMVAERHVLHSLARCRAADVVEWANRATELAGVDDEGRRISLEGEAIACVARAVLQGTPSALERLDALEDVAPEGPVQQRLSLARGWVLYAAGDHLAARDELERAAAGDGWGGSFRISLWARAWLARVHLETGRWELAEATASTGAHQARQRGLDLLVPLLEWTRAEVAALRGDLAAADEAVWSGAADASHYEVMRVSSALGRAAVERARDNPHGVLEALAPLDQTWVREWVSYPGFWPWVEPRVDALLRLGRRQEADEVLRLHEVRTQQVGHPVQAARLAGLRARLELLEGDPQRARAQHAAALEAFETRPLPLDRLRLHQGWAATLRRSGRRSEAEQEVSQARQVLAELGLAAAGRVEPEVSLPVAEGTPTGEVIRFTPQELAVATLVANGRTNREVAGELFLSVKTVQYHLTRIYSKLGIRSRGELAARGLDDVTAG